MLFGALNYTLTYNGQEVDLSQCQVSVAVTPTEFLQAWIDDPAAGVMMTMDMDMAAGDDVAEDGEPTEADMAEAMGMMFTANTSQRGMVTYAVTQGADVTFYVQYYAKLDRLVTQEGEGTALDVIDTSNGGSGTGGRLPVNGQPNATKEGENGKTPIRNIYLKADGTVVTKSVLTEIYKRGENGKYIPGKGSEFQYFAAPGLQYFNIVSTVQDIQYKITEVWIQKGNESGDVGDHTSLKSEDWLVRPFTEGVTRFTNRPETAAANQDYILIGPYDVIRLIYTPLTKEGGEIFPADFYDYDISNGKIYTSRADAQNQANGKNTSTQTSGTWYTNTNQCGINTAVDGTGTQLTFGNANAGVDASLTNGWRSKWEQGNSYPNVYNKNWGGDKAELGYKGCTFGIASGMNPTGNDITLASGLKSNSLFGGSSGTGKTLVSNIKSVQFIRVGDTYTLRSIPDTETKDLEKFGHPGIYDGVQNKKVIWTNHFWPMDDAETYGADGHDMKFGARGTNRRHQNTGINGGNLPNNDDSEDHNSYFGMNFAVEFELTKNYIGPLEYYFFGDDDMWAFLSEVEPVIEDGKEVIDPVTGKPKTKIKSDVPSRKIVDIGGVHSAVGQYVDLWDYVNTDNWADNERRTYRLTFFYTERGASGSTCWMRFTLPTVVGVNLENQINDLLKDIVNSCSLQPVLHS